MNDQKIIVRDLIIVVVRSTLAKLSSLVTIFCVGVAGAGVWRRAGGTVQCWQAGQGRYQLMQAKH